MAVEPLIAERAAVARDDADVDFITGLHRRLCAVESDAEFMELDTEFHLAVGRAGHNGFFTEASEQLRLVVNKGIAALPETDLWHERTNREHAAILAAICARDGSRAHAAMRAHVSNTDRSIRAFLAAM
jgi:DNA-binding FadR family transcriptional regulator